MKMSRECVIKRHDGVHLFFFFLPLHLQTGLIEIRLIKSHVDRCAVAAGCSVQPAATSTIINHAYAKAKLTTGNTLTKTSLIIPLG